MRGTGLATPGRPTGLPLTHRHRHRRLALLAVALAGAAALVVVPVAIRVTRTTTPTCVGPSTAGAVSVGAGIGAGAIGLSVVPGAGPRVPVSVRSANAPASVTRLGTLWLTAPGQPAVALGRRGPDCWGGAAPTALLAEVAIRTAGDAAAPVVARFALPAPLVSGAALLARARAATLRLVALRQVTDGRRSTTARPARVTTRYAGSTVVSSSASGILRFSWPGWRDGFEWITPGIEASVVLGDTTVDGVRAVRVAGAVAETPLWMQLDIDPSTGAVLADSMNGANHVMSSTYTPIGR